MVKDYVEYQIRKILGFEGEIYFIDHHKSHAASSYYYSGFDESAILTIDGVSEWATTTYGSGVQEKIDVFEKLASLILYCRI